MSKIRVNNNLCKGCGLCIINCPKNILVLSETVNDKGHRTVVQIEENKCIGCALCGIVCPDSAITVYKEDENK